MPLLHCGDTSWVCNTCTTATTNAAYETESKSNDFSFFLTNLTLQFQSFGGRIIEVVLLQVFEAREKKNKGKKEKGKTKVSRDTFSQ